MSTLQIDFGHAEPRIVGIDLGTTNSLVAVMDLTGPRILSGIVPSVVSVTESGEVIAGSEAHSLFGEAPHGPRAGGRAGRAEVVPVPAGSRRRVRTETAVGREDHDAA